MSKPIGVLGVFLDISDDSTRLLVGVLVAVGDLGWGIKGAEILFMELDTSVTSV